jgi:hypothetical protein
MKHVTALAAFTLATANMAHADTTTKPLIVVELFTSQGCYSCPPADKILTQLAGQDDVLALGLHVDYWDYLGWKDTFAISKFGERQSSYNAQIIKRSRRVTPQMIFNGVAEVAGGVGKSALMIDQNVKALRGKKEHAKIDLDRNGKTVTMNLWSDYKNLGLAEINLVEYSPSEVVKIKRGENAGKSIEYTNIVKSFDTVAKWDTRKKVKVSFDLPNNGHYAVVVQGKQYGPVYVARKIPSLSN